MNIDWNEYERLKKELSGGLSEDEYEREIQKIIKQLEKWGTEQ